MIIDINEIIDSLDIERINDENTYCLHEDHIFDYGMERGFRYMIDKCLCEHKLEILFPTTIKRFLKDNPDYSEDIEDNVDIYICWIASLMFMDHVDEDDIDEDSDSNHLIDNFIYWVEQYHSNGQFLISRKLINEFENDIDPNYDDKEDEFFIKLKRGKVPIRNEQIMLREKQYKKVNI